MNTPTALPADVGRRLLVLARESIAGSFRGEALPAAGMDNPVLRQARGAFVTLKKSGVLRGCIGRIESSLPLWETVARVARSSAFDDPRFPPLELDELNAVEIEVSVMTPPQPVASVDDVVPGVHGVIVELGSRRALFLPQVASEQGWNRETLLEQLCFKAGLPARAYRDPGAHLQVFRAEVFHE
jgi:AmmeMemoRadiSam system protein A